MATRDPGSPVLYDKKCDICSEVAYQVIGHVHGYDIVCCPGCDLVYATVTENDTASAYEIDYYKSVYPDYEDDRNVHEANNILLLREIEKYFSRGNLIEIGSAFGFFLEVARRRGWEACGYEVSEYASTIARNRYGQDVRNEDFLTAATENKVDVICMFDTIEHLLRPSLHIAKISQALEKGGGLIITTGDLSSWLARISGMRWRMFVPPLHIYYYSRKTITRLLTQNGFEILSICHKAKYQNFNSILQYQLGIRKDVLPRIPVKVNLGDIMQIIARRT